MQFCKHASHATTSRTFDIVDGRRYDSRIVPEQRALLIVQRIVCLLRHCEHALAIGSAKLQHIAGERLELGKIERNDLMAR